MAGVEKNEPVFGESKSNESTLQEGDDRGKHGNQEAVEKLVTPMDSFERIEAEILQEVTNEYKSPVMTGFVEDYSMREGTTLSADFTNPRELRKQPKLDELAALDLQWRINHQPKQAIDTGEVDEKALERLEVAALIKKAEQKLLPADREDSGLEEFQEETLGVAKESQEFVPELVKLDKIISAADLIQMESSDLSEEEGFRLRLSCIFEESESDTSGSGSLARTVKYPVKHTIELGQEGTKLEGEENMPTLIREQQQLHLDSVEKIAPENVERTLNESSREKTLEIFQPVNVLDGVQVITDIEKQTSAQDDQCTGTDPNQAKQITDENKSLPDLKENIRENYRLETKSPDDTKTEPELKKLTEENVTIFDEMEKRETLIKDMSEITESIESSSPEPSYQAQKHGNNTRIETIDSMESSSPEPPYAVKKFGPHVDSVDLVDSVESSSPEPTFGIRRLQSGTRVDKLLTRPSLTKRLESSSDSSLDISTATTSPGAEDPKIPEKQNLTQTEVEEITEILPTLDSNVQQKSDVRINENSNSQAVTRSNSDLSLDVSTLTSSQAMDISKSATFENVDKSTESPALDFSTKCDAVEMREVAQAAFPKLGRSRRGRSLEQEALPAENKEDGRSVASFDIHQATEEQLQNMFPKVKKGRRGRSLESGMAEKEAQQQENPEEKPHLETSSQKGEEERPPVPPETYLWEELRRWRMKGGYPWTYLDKPPFDEKTWKNRMDHEYEPINPPPQDRKTLERSDSAEVAAAQVEDVANARRFLRIPRDDELVVSAVSPEDMEVEAIGAARDFQDDLEDRFLATSMTTTTASRTDCDVNTSMLDSSGLEDLPLKRDSRSKKALQTKTEQMRAQAQGLQQRIRSQAGKLRNKLRSIPRPSFQRKQERTKSEEDEKPRFRLPERPKFNLPERPKFNLPERPKFKMPQKPKISLPNFTKPLRERQAAQSKSPGEPKKNMFDLDFRTYPRMFNKKSRDRGEYATSSPKMPRSATPPPAPIQPARKKGPIGQRWVNRFDDIKFADDRGSEMSHQSDRSEHSESLSGFHDKDFAIADDLENTQLPPPRTLSTKSSISHLSDRELVSSRSSEDRHRKGVLEEIDSDQFFLRQKGISEDDIDMGKYLSDEIREAFRSPVVNALRQLDIDYDEHNIEKLKEKSRSEEPLPPNRTRSLKRTPKINSTEERTLEKEVDLPASQAGEEPSTIRYENVQENSSKPRQVSVEEDNVSEYYKSPPPPQEYQHYKVPRPTPQPTPAKRKSSRSEQTPNKKKHSEGWVEVEVETSFEEVPPEAIISPQPLQRKKSKKSLEGRQLSRETPNKVEDSIEPDYIIPAEIPPDAPKRTRSLSRGARSIHSLAQEEEKIKPVPPKRSSSKKSLQSLGLSNDPPKKDPDSRSVHSLALEDRRAGAVAPKRIKSLSRGSRSIQSLANYSNLNEATSPPQPPERVRSLSRNSHASRSYHSLADDEQSWAQQAPPYQTRSLSRPSRSKQPPKSSEAEQPHHYEAPSEDGYAGYAVVEKPKPPRPPPPRRRKGSRSPTFNTLPRRSPIRPVRNYATLGPSRPPRKSKPIKPAQSLEHIYSSDQISQAYAQVEDSLQATQTEDLHGSSKDLQASNVIERMKGRPLPAPPRPPRFKGKSEEQNSSLDVEEVEEVCVSTQTDPLPDDVCLEDDIIQEFSHEQLKIQEEFLKEMREEEERIQRQIEAKRARHIDVTVESEENEAKMEIIRQMDDIIREERRLLLDERQAEEDNAQEEAKKTQELQLQVHEDDMGYASLDRRQTRPDDEPQPSTSFQQPLPPPRTVQATLRTEPAPPAPAPSPQEPVYIPLVPEIVSTERLRVGQLEVDRLTVNQLEATSLTVQDLRTNGIQTQDVRGTSLQIQDITSHSGQLNLRNIELPPEFIQQIIARIPWEEIRPAHNVPEQETLPPTAHAATAPRRVPAPEEEQTQSSAPQTATARRRHRALRQRSRSQYSSDEDSGEGRQTSSRRPPRAVIAEPRTEVSIGELGQQLARACTNAGLRAMRDFAAQVRPPAAEEDRTRYVQAVLLVALIAIAGFILFSLNTKDVHHHHWDFQFPPQPPRL